MNQLSGNTSLRAGLYMVLAMGAFVSNDTLVKLVGQSLPVGEIIMLRGAMAMVIIGALCLRRGILGSVLKLRSGSVVLRNIFDLMATILFVTSLMHMQIANLTAILQAVPLAVALLSVFFLGEKVGWRRSIAIVAGFIGVLLIVRPTPASFSLYDLLALLIVFAVAIRDIVTKRIPLRVPTLMVALVNAIFVTVGGLVMSLFGTFVVPQGWQIGLLALAALFLSAGYLLMVETLRLGELSGTAPFRYSIMVFAIISGVAVFGEFPDAIAMAGMALIVITGLYAAHREARLNKRALAVPSQR
jgi:drug/metabolite transporter (DMT)-like permease